MHYEIENQILIEKNRKLEGQNSLLIEKIKNFRNEIRNWDIYESYNSTSKEEIYGNFNDYFKEELK